MHIKKGVLLPLVCMLLVSMTFEGCGAGGQTGSGTGKSDKAESGFQKDYVPSEFAQTDVESDTIQWFCSAYAIYTRLNKKDLGVIGGTLPEDKEIHERAIKEALDSGWEINSHRSAVKKINKLLSGGYRKKYRELIADMKKEGLLDLSKDKIEDAVYETRDDNDDASECICAYYAYKELGENAIDGWDYCRALQILGDCYQADYISLEECLDESLIVAKKLQSTFANWEDVCKSYLYGHYFWGHDSVDTEWRWGLYEELNAMPDGPYTVPYDTELKENWKGVKGSKPDTPEVKEEQKTAKTDEKERYILTNMDKDKEVFIKASDDYEYNSEWSSEDNLVFDYKPDGNDTGTYYETLTYRVDKSEDPSVEEETFTAIIQDNEADWKKDSLYEEVQYVGTQETKTEDYTVKYCFVRGLSGSTKKSYDKQCYAWLQTSDGYTVSCLIFESTYDVEDKDISEKKVLNVMSQIYEK